MYVYKRTNVYHTYGYHECNIDFYVRENIIIDEFNITPIYNLYVFARSFQNFNDIDTYPSDTQRLLT